MKFEDIYREHKNLVYNLTLHYVQNVEDAQEVTQDVFVSAHQSLDSFKHDSTIRTWLYRITINKSLDLIKAKQRKKRFANITSLFFENSAELKYNPAAIDHPGIELENKEATERIFRLINQLPDNQKTVLILHKIELRSQVEIAEIMDISPKAVESLMQRAKTNLATKLNAPKV
jgi:RNA polymerase sigma factor (sigma-70 family)